jgi:hypothetical protein
LVAPLHDEIFQGTLPVPAGVDAASTYCYLLAVAEHRDADTWGVHLLDAARQGLKPDYTIADAGQGLRAGQKAAWDDTPCQTPSLGSDASCLIPHDSRVSREKNRNEWVTARPSAVWNASRLIRPRWWRSGFSHSQRFTLANVPGKPRRKQTDSAVAGNFSATPHASFAPMRSSLSAVVRLPEDSRPLR